MMSTGECEELFKNQRPVSGAFHLPELRTGLGIFLRCIGQEVIRSPAGCRTLIVEA